MFPPISSLYQVSGDFLGIALTLGTAVHTGSEERLQPVFGWSLAVWFHSQRSATTGSTREARRAGR